MMRVMSAVLTLDLPWVEVSPTAIEDLQWRRGRVANRAYDDGIVLDVGVATGPTLGS